MSKSKNNQVFNKLLGQVKAGKKKLNLKPIAEGVRKQIIRRTRTGKGVKNKNFVNLAALKDKTIDKREEFSENLSTFTRPNRSNLTATGQLLDSIDVKRVTPTTFTLDFKDARKYELDNSRPRVTNSKLALYVQKTRPFFEISKTEENKIRRDIKKQLLKSIKF